MDSDHRSYVLTSQEREAKVQAILRHASQLKLRRRFMLHFADEPERFGMGPAPMIPNGGTPPLRLLRATEDQWEFSVRRTLWAAFGRVTLLLISRREGVTHSFRVPLPRGGGRRGLLGPDRRSNLGEIITRRRGDLLHVTIVGPALRHADLQFAKLELSWERRLGFFDRWPWVCVGLDTHSTSFAISRPAEESRPGPALSPVESLTATRS